MSNFLIDTHELQEIRIDLMSYDFPTIADLHNDEIMNTSCGDWGCGFGCQGDCDGSCKDWGCESGNDGND